MQKVTRHDFMSRHFSVENCNEPHNFIGFLQIVISFCASSIREDIVILRNYKINTSERRNYKTNTSEFYVTPTFSVP